MQQTIFLRALLQHSICRSQSYVDSVRDDDPQKYEITAQLTVTDDDGATATDTVTIYINQRPTATIGIYAGLRDPNVVADADTTTKDLYSIPGVIDGPGENGNADNEWDVAGGAYVALDGFVSSDPDNLNGAIASYSWELISPGSAPTIRVNGSDVPAINDPDTPAAGPTFVVGAIDNSTGDATTFEGTTLVDIVGASRTWQEVHVVLSVDCVRPGVRRHYGHYRGHMRHRCRPEPCPGWPVDHQDRGSRHLAGARTVD